MSETFHICEHAGTEGECQRVTVPDVGALTRERNELKRHLRQLIETNRHALAALDLAMEGPSTHERGKKIGLIAASLDHATDSADHFGLDSSFPAIGRSKAKARAKVRGDRTR